MTLKFITLSLLLSSALLFCQSIGQSEVEITGPEAFEALFTSEDFAPDGCELIEDNNIWYQSRLLPEIGGDWNKEKGEVALSAYWAQHVIGSDLANDHLLRQGHLNMVNVGVVDVGFDFNHVQTERIADHLHNQVISFPLRKPEEILHGTYVANLIAADRP